MKQLLRHSATSLKKHNWESYSIEYIISAKDADNVPLLKLFLQDYTKLFSTQVNAGCFKCLSQYLVNYKQKLYKMENQNTCQYKLKPKYNLLPLEFGSNIYVTNNNINDEKGLILMKRFHALGKTPDVIFEVFPENYIELLEEQTENTTEENTTDATSENVEQSKKKTRKRSK